MIICKHCGAIYGNPAYKKTTINGQTIYIPLCPKCLKPFTQPQPTTKKK